LPFLLTFFPTLLPQNSLSNESHVRAWFLFHQKRTEIVQSKMEHFCVRNVWIRIKLFKKLCMLIFAFFWQSNNISRKQKLIIHASLTPHMHVRRNLEYFSTSTSVIFYSHLSQIKIGIVNNVSGNRSETWTKRRQIKYRDVKES
jgi:hypothetical protein